MLRFIAEGTGKAKMGRSGIDSCLAYMAVNLEEERRVGAESRGRSEAMPGPRNGAANADAIAVCLAGESRSAGRLRIGSLDAQRKSITLYVADIDRLVDCQRRGLRPWERRRRKVDIQASGVEVCRDKKMLA